jgi:iron complex outermembrane receptor protein
MSDSSSWLQAATGHAAQRGRTLCVCVIAGLVALACGAPARAQQADLSQASLEELSNIRVYSASRFEQSTEDAPSSVTVVTADEIERHGYRTLADVLNSVRGFYVNYDRNYSYVGVRGFAPAGDYNTRILLMVDGHRLNDNIYDQGLIGTDLPISLDLVDRIEIVRGPNSSLYGTNAFLATVDIITKRGSQVDGLEVSTSAGSFGTYFGRATFGKKIGETEFLVSGDGYGSRGQDLFYREYDSPLTNAGWARRADDDSYHQFFLQARYRGVSLQALYGTREKGIPTGAFDTAFNDPRNRTVDERRYITLGYERSFAREWRLESSLFLDEYSYAGTYVIPTETGPGIAEPDWSRGQWWGADLRVSRPVGEKHRIFFGTEFRDNFQQDQGNYLLDPLLVFLDDRRSSSIVGLYGQAEITLRHDLRLNLGFRNDHYSTFGNTTNPRASSNNISTRP